MIGLAVTPNPSSVMIAILLLVMAAVALRALGAALRHRRQPAWVRVSGWMAASLGAWLAAGALGAWFPVWPVLLLGLLAASLHGYRPHLGWAVGLDAVVVLAAGAFSVPRLEPALIIAGAVGVALVGRVADRMLQSGERTLPHRAVAIPALVGAFALSAEAALRVTPTVYAWHRTHATALFHTGVSRAVPGERVRLGESGVGWASRPAGRATRPGAILFHGDHPSGSTQPSVSAMRRALLHAGYAVLAVDHVGYGQTPPPPENAPIEAWDHLPSAEAAIRFFRDDPAIDRVFLFGHSMGVSVALRALAAHPDLDGAVLLGGSVPFQDVTDEYRHRRFHRRRRLEYRLPMDATLEILRLYHDAGRLAAELPPRHSRIRFVRFGFEHDDVTSLRDRLYDAIPGDKEIWDFRGTTHYFSTYSVPTGGEAGLLVGNVRAARALARRLQELADRP